MVATRRFSMGRARLLLVASLGGAALALAVLALSVVHAAGSADAVSVDFETADNMATSVGAGIVATTPTLTFPVNKESARPAHMLLTSITLG